MRPSDQKGRLYSVAGSGSKAPQRKLSTRLSLILIPASILILAASGLSTYTASSEFINTATERVSRAHATTTAHALETRMEGYRRDLLLAAQMPISAKSMARHLAERKAVDGDTVTEFGFIPNHAEEHIVFVAHQGVTIELGADEVKEIRPNPVLFYGDVKNLKPGEVWLSPFKEVEYPFAHDDAPHARISLSIIRMFTPCMDAAGEVAGYLYIGLDVRKLRNVLSLYDSTKSPVYAFPRNPSVTRYTFFYDAEGWVIFQSESPDTPEVPLSTLGVRAVQKGTLGRPGLPNAFKPLDDETQYWNMVTETGRGERSLFHLDTADKDGSDRRRHVVAFAPVRLRLSSSDTPQVVGGVAFVDRSALVESAGNRHLHIMLVIIAAAVVCITSLIAFTTRLTTRGLMDLASRVSHVREEGRWEEIRLRNDAGYEASILGDSINAMIATIRKQLEEIRTKDIRIESAALKEPVALTMDDHGQDEDVICPEIIGSGPLMHTLKRDIVKAGQVDVDVLIEGDTGTGKQLAAEAVHRLSRRAGKPFISINCGELDEHLLLDTLFGHVKGAFTDGKTDRRGAFLEADGGTLFLDEIQSASLKVQQALLRAIAMRKVRPLGSDRETEVNVRLITASNLDLKTLIDQGKFREDLYYRLKVITIQTPPLREHLQNVPQLALHFLKEAEHMAGRTGLSISRGALEALLAYHWPGNIRELKHVIITAAVMAEGKVIQAEQLNLDLPDTPRLASAAAEPRPAQPPVTSTVTPSGAEQAAPAVRPLPPDLNRRQIAAYEHVLRTGEITSRELIRLMGGDISKRTASYDIQDLVSRNLLFRVGRGPNTRYVLPESEPEKG